MPGNVVPSLMFPTPGHVPGSGPAPGHAPGPGTAPGQFLTLGCMLPVIKDVPNPHQGIPKNFIKSL